MKKILVVEDDLNIRFITEELLKSVNYKVNCVTNGLEAVSAMNSEKYDMVITDLMMPVMDGKELLKNIRRTKGEKFPVIVASGSDYESIRFLENEYTKTLQKPYAFDVLLDQVRLMVN